MKLFLSCAGIFPVSKFIYKLAKIEKKQTNKQKQKTKVEICTKTVSVCYFDDDLCHT